jgi:hypothetical protein
LVSLLSLSTKKPQAKGLGLVYASDGLEDQKQKGRNWVRQAA